MTKEILNIINKNSIGRCLQSFWVNTQKYAMGYRRHVQLTLENPQKILKMLSVFTPTSHVWKIP